MLHLFVFIQTGIPIYAAKLLFFTVRLYWNSESPVHSVESTISNPVVPQTSRYHLSTRVPVDRKQAPLISRLIVVLLFPWSCWFCFSTLGELMCNLVNANRLCRLLIVVRPILIGLRNPTNETSWLYQKERKGTAMLKSINLSMIGIPFNLQVCKLCTLM